MLAAGPAARAAHALLQFLARAADSSLAGGLLLGLGLGLPTRTQGQVRRSTLDEVNSGRSAAIANKAAERGALPEGPADGTHP